MKFLALLITSYLVAGVLDFLSKRNRSTTKSLNKFTVRTVMDVAYICAIGVAMWIAFIIFILVSEPERLDDGRFMMVFVPVTVIWLVVTFWGMLAPVKGVWDIVVDGDDVTVIKAFVFKRHWKISNISYCKAKRGGMNVYVEGRRRKAFFIDGMTDHYSNFVKRMEKEGKEIRFPAVKS